MRHLHRSTVVLGFVFALSCFMAEAMTTRQRLSKFGDDLREVIQKNVSPSRKAVREQLSQDLSTQFNNEIRELTPPKGFTMQKATDCFLGSLEDMYTLFPTEASRTERNLFMKACTDTYKHECKRSTDYAAPRTLQECYDMLLRNLESGAKRFAQERCREARQETQTAFNTTFGEITSTATIPDNVDLAQQLADNVDRARQLFPVTTKDLADRNGALVSMLESAAKRIEQRARTTKKPVK